MQSACPCCCVEGTEGGRESEWKANYAFDWDSASVDLKRSNKHSFGEFVDFMSLAAERPTYPPRAFL